MCVVDRASWRSCWYLWVLCGVFVCVFGPQSAYNRVHEVNRTAVEQTEPSASSFGVLLCIHRSMRYSMRMRSVGLSIRTRFFIININIWHINNFSSALHVWMLPVLFKEESNELSRRNNYQLVWRRTCQIYIWKQISTHFASAEKKKIGEPCKNSIGVHLCVLLLLCRRYHNKRVLALPFILRYWRFDGIVGNSTMSITDLRFGLPSIDSISESGVAFQWILNIRTNACKSLSGISHVCFCTLSFSTTYLQFLSCHHQYSTSAPEWY